MSRSRVGLTLGLAVLVGALLGWAAFRLAGPLPLASADPSPPVSVPPATATASPTPTPTPTASPTPTPSPTPSPTSSPTTKAAKPARPVRTTAPRPPTAAPPSVSTPPPFTVAALLPAAQFREFGWGEASVTQSWNDLPSEQITYCTEVTSNDGPIEAAYAARYQGESTTAAETVVRFESTAAARTAVQGLIGRIGACEPPDGESAGLAAERMAAPAPDGISELYLWNTTGPPTVEGVVGLARAGDRIALVSLESETTDPVQTTQVGALMLAAGQRLR